MGKAEIILTGEKDALHTFARKLTQLQLHVFVMPTIEFEKCMLGKDEQQILSEVSSYDYLFFTSVRAVRYFVEALAELHIDVASVQVPVVAVGPVTAHACTEAGLQVIFTPPRFTVEDMVKTLPSLSGTKILFPRSLIAPVDTTKAINDAGAQVTPLLLYRTVYRKDALTQAEQDELTQANTLVFLSPSSVKSFVNLIGDSTLPHVQTNATAVCIGPRTTRIAEALGFKNSVTAKTFTTDGVLQTLAALI